MVEDAEKTGEKIETAGKNVIEAGLPTEITNLTIHRPNTRECMDLE